jgi:hypothetical protein
MKPAFKVVFGMHARMCSVVPYGYSMVIVGSLR